MQDVADPLCELDFGLSPPPTTSKGLLVYDNRSRDGGTCAFARAKGKSLMLDDSLLKYALPGLTHPFFACQFAHS